MKRWALVPLVLALGAIFTPWLMSHSPAFALTLQNGFALVCHQQADRSFFLFGGTVAVCARCLGIYLGAALGLLVRVSRRMAWGWLIVAVALNLVDGGTEFAGLHGNWMLTRSALGLTLGATAAMLVIASVDKSQHCHSRKEA